MISLKTIPSIPNNLNHFIFHPIFSIYAKPFPLSSAVISFPHLTQCTKLSGTAPLHFLHILDLLLPSMASHDIQERYGSSFFTGNNGTKNKVKYITRLLYIVSPLYEQYGQMVCFSGVEYPSGVLSQFFVLEVTPQQIIPHMSLRK